MEDKTAYALPYMARAAQNWAMSILQALDEGRLHDLMDNYNAFCEAVIAEYGTMAISIGGVPQKTR